MLRSVIDDNCNHDTVLLRFFLPYVFHFGANIEIMMLMLFFDCVSYGNRIMSSFPFWWILCIIPSLHRTTYCILLSGCNISMYYPPLLFCCCFWLTRWRFNIVFYYAPSTVVLVFIKYVLNWCLSCIWKLFPPFISVLFYFKSVIFLHLQAVKPCYEYIIIAFTQYFPHILPYNLMVASWFTIS